MNTADLFKNYDQCEPCIPGNMVVAFVDFDNNGIFSLVKNRNKDYFTSEYAATKYIKKVWQHFMRQYYDKRNIVMSDDAIQEQIDIIFQKNEHRFRYETININGKDGEVIHYEIADMRRKINKQ